MTITTGPDGTEYVPVVDISKHQGVADLTVMRAKGVEGLIIRSNHAQMIDERCSAYLADARAAGFPDDQIGFYTFCNPKRATGYASGKAFVDTVRQVFGRTDTVLMLDIESYHAEPGSGPLIQGAEFVSWIRDHIRAIDELAPDATLIAYSNASFWDGNAGPVTGQPGPWVGDAELAAELEWIVPRYPVYPPTSVSVDPRKLALWVAMSSKPPAPAGWAGWAFSKAAGPISPRGAKWSGWQFSAGWNRQGPVYGCQSSDLDLNIVRADVWRRWTGDPAIPPPPSPDEEDDVKAVIYTVRDDQGSDSFVWLRVSDNDRVRQVVNGRERDLLLARGDVAGDPESTAHFRQMLRTYEPVGELNATAVQVLGPSSVEYWNERSSVTVVVPPIEMPMITVPVLDGVIQLVPRVG